MIVKLADSAGEDYTAALLGRIIDRGIRAVHARDLKCLVLQAKGPDARLEELDLASDPCVEAVVPIDTAYQLASRAFRPEDTVVDFRGVQIGGGRFTVIAGPCAVESRDQLLEAVKRVKAAGARCMRGSAHKPRTSPYSFQGLGEEGLRIAGEVARELGIPAVSEVLDVGDIEPASRYVDVLQVGARNMQNFALLKALGEQRMPVILKRGMSATVEELLLAAEYLMLAGNQQIVLCERGIRTFEPATRNTLDLNIVAYLKTRTHLPVIVDPSHGTGRRELVAPMAKAAVGCGADGVMIEVHCNPDAALSDGHQSLHPHQFEALMRELPRFVAAAGKHM